MLSAYFKIQPAVAPELPPASPAPKPQPRIVEHVKPAARPKKPKRPRDKRPVEPYDGGGSLAQYKPAGPPPVHCSEDEDEFTAPVAPDEYEYLMREALEAGDEGKDDETEAASTDFEDESDSASSMASSPEACAPPEFLARRRRPAPSEAPMYAGPELWYDDAEYSDDEFSEAEG